MAMINVQPLSYEETVISANISIRMRIAHGE